MPPKEPPKEKEKEKPLHPRNPQVLLSWIAPLRPYKKRGGGIIRFYLALAFLLSLIIIFFGDKIVLVPVWAILFLFYVLTVTPPMEVEHKVTKFGIESADLTARWEVLSHFYFSHRFGYDILTLVTHPPYNFHMYIVLPDDEVKQKVFKILSEHIIYLDKPKKTITERAADLLSHLVPDEA